LAIAVDTIEELPPIDERLALPEAGYEIIDGVVMFVPPALPPHAERHQTISVLIGTHVHRNFKVAIDMLTRTSKIDDIAPDVSVFARAPDPQTGRRQLEQLAFEVVSIESMGHATKKAAKLADRGVRRVFAIDITRRRVVEWSRDAETWRVLDVRGVIDDPTLAVPLSVTALLEAADTDDEVARALIAKHNPVFEAEVARTHEQGRAEGRAEGRVEAIVELLAARGLACSAEQRERILRERDSERVSDWMRRVSTCFSVEDLLG
jgi:Uma2 family endonuclease